MRVVGLMLGDGVAAMMRDRDIPGYDVCGVRERWSLALLHHIWKGYGIQTWRTASIEGRRSLFELLVEILLILLEFVLLLIVYKNANVVTS